TLLGGSAGLLGSSSQRMSAYASQLKLMNSQSSKVTPVLARIVGRLVLAAVLAALLGPARAGAQGSRARRNPLPAQPVRNTYPFPGTMSGVGRYAPFPVKDTSAAERAVLASGILRTIIDGWVGRALAVPRPAGGAADAAALFRPEVAERLGQWSLRWQDAQ